MTSVLATSDLTVNGTILLYNECPVIQSNINTTEAVNNLGTVSIPFDDTIPQNTEGGEVITCSIIPQRADSTLKVEFLGPFSSSASGTFVVCLFRDSTADALRTISEAVNTAGSTVPVMCKLDHSVSANSTSSTTFKIRAGKRAGDGGTVTNNAALWGGTLTTTLRVTEIMNKSTNYTEP